jgi:hypothetical protein
VLAPDVQCDDNKKTKMVRCRASDVASVLGLPPGAGVQRALVAVAQLAGGDYDTGGADNVGEVLAMAAVRSLLKGEQVNSGFGKGLAWAFLWEPMRCKECVGLMCVP